MRIAVTIVARFAQDLAHSLKTVVGRMQCSKAERKQCSAVSRYAVSSMASVIKGSTLSLNPLKKSGAVGAPPVPGVGPALLFFEKEVVVNTGYASFYSFCFAAIGRPLLSLNSDQAELPP